MVLDEHELRQQLEAAAEHVSPPRFTAERLISRIRRRRARIIGLLSGSLLAMVAIAITIPIALIGPASPSSAHPQVAPFRLSFTMAVNGQVRVFPKGGAPLSITVTPGKRLGFRIGVVVPARANVTTLWLGISKGAFGTPGRDGQRPSGVRPILAHARRPLAAGTHTFGLTWTPPVQFPRGTSLMLVAAWRTKQEDTSVSQIVAVLAPPR